MRRVGSKGLGLLEVISALSVIGLISYFFAQMLSSSNKMFGYNRARNDWETTMSSLNRIFVDEDSCAGAFRATGGAADSFNLTIPIGGVVATPDSIAFKGTAQQIKVGQTIGNYRVQDITITRLDNPVDAPNASGPRWRWSTILAITATFNGTGAPVAGVTQLKKEFALNIFTPNTGTATILTCSGKSTLSNQGICQAMANGIYDAVTDKCSIGIENRTSDPATPAVGQMWLRTDL